MHEIIDKQIYSKSILEIKRKTLPNFLIPCDKKKFIHSSI